MMNMQSQQQFPAAPCTGDLLDEGALARYLSVSPAWLTRARHLGTGPAFSKVGRMVRYSMADVLAWLETRKRTGPLKGGGACTFARETSSVG